jgi:hypothetical protein
MRYGYRLLSALMIAGALASPTLVTGCFHHQYANGQYANGQYANGQYANGSWSDSERPHYAQWEQSTKQEHRDYSARNASEQQQYWSWRHDNP